MNKFIMKFSFDCKFVVMPLLGFVILLQISCGTSTVHYPIDVQKKEFIHLNLSADQSITHPVYVFTHQSTLVNDQTQNVLRQGGLNPPVLLLHELPGLSPETLWYADMLAKHFTVYVPLLFGDPNLYSLPTGLMAYAFNGEWKEVNDPKGSRPIIQWLKKVLKFIDGRHQKRHKIGIIGMCLTGSLPLALVDHSRVHGVVVAQPSLPLIALSKETKESLGISKTEGELAKTRAKSNDGNAVRIYGVRFEMDTTAKRAKHLKMKKDFNNGFIDREIRSGEYNVKKDGNTVYEISDGAHSTLVIEWENFPEHPSQIRREEIVEFLLDPLNYTPPNPPTGE